MPPTFVGSVRFVNPAIRGGGSHGRAAAGRGGERRSAERLSALGDPILRVVADVSSADGAKAAIEQASELFGTAPAGIRVHAVAPGIMDTPAVSGLIGMPAAREGATKQYPLPGVGGPADLMSLIAWLLSPSAGKVTGQVWAVDGGFSAIRPLVR